LALVGACGSGSSAPADGSMDLASGDGSVAGDLAVSSARGFPATAPWVSYYGAATAIDLAKVAATFRIINIDADPGVGNFTAQQIATLRAGGQNRVISYLNLGSCESFRTYWSAAPAGLVSCDANSAAKLGPYDGYPDETWMNPGNADYQNLILEHVAARIAALGVDGFFFDNLEIVEHGTNTTNGPCDAACSQGGLDLVRKLRERFPDLLFVMQNATSDVTRLGMTGGVDYPSLLDGISHEEVYAPTMDATAESELVAWRALPLSPGGRQFFVGTEDYVGSCTSTAAAMTVYTASRAHGFSPYATDQSAGQMVICYWPF
jgi:cysteinyl-tRNA synthetase, unknown class